MLSNGKFNSNEELHPLLLSQHSNGIIEEKNNQNHQLESKTRENNYNHSIYCKTFILMAILAFTTSFGTGMVYFSVNTAMDAFKLFVNDSIFVSGNK